MRLGSVVFWGDGTMSWARVPVCDEGECLRCGEEKLLAIPMGDDGMFGYCAPCCVLELVERIEAERGDLFS